VDVDCDSVLVLPGEREPGGQARELVGEVVVEDGEDVGLFALRDEDLEAQPPVVVAGHLVVEPENGRAAADTSRCPGHGRSMLVKDRSHHPAPIGARLVERRSC